MDAPGPALSLDFGTRRIGLAVSDAEGRLAFPVGTLERRDLAADLEALRRLVSERGIRHLVLGLPLHMDGRAGDMARVVRDFARRLEGATGLTVELLDERWTTREAERALREIGGRRGRRRRRGADVDSIAATLLLRTWLERRRVAPEGG